MLEAEAVLMIQDRYVGYKNEVTHDSGIELGEGRRGFIRSVLYRRRWVGTYKKTAPKLRRRVNNWGSMPRESNLCPGLSASRFYSTCHL